MSTNDNNISNHDLEVVDNQIDTEQDNDKPEETKQTNSFICNADDQIKSTNSVLSDQQAKQKSFKQLTTNFNEKEADELMRDEEVNEEISQDDIDQEDYDSQVGGDSILLDSQYNEIKRDNKKKNSCIIFLTQFNIACCAGRNQIYPETLKEHDKQEIKVKLMFGYIEAILRKNNEETVRRMLKQELKEDTTCNINNLFQGMNKAHSVNFQHQLNYNFFENFSQHVFIRHSERADQAGETELVTVACDSPLSNNGYKLAEKAADKLIIKIENLIQSGFQLRIFCSPQLRCLQTCLQYLSSFKSKMTDEQFKGTKIIFDVDIRETQNIINQKQQDLEEDYISNAQPYHKLILQSDKELIEKNLKEFGMSFDNLEIISLAEINEMKDSHILVEDAELCVIRAQKMLNKIKETIPKTINLQFTHKNTLSTIANVLNNDFYFQNKYQCESDFQAYNNQFQSANKFFEKVQHDKKYNI